PISVTTTSICCRTNSGGTSKTDRTSTVFCAVRAVIADIPNTPNAANVFRSAWIPAPPPESEPAIVSARGTTPSLPPLSEVIPTLRGERTAGDAVEHPAALGRGEDFPDAGERHRETVRETRCVFLELASRGEEQFVVLPSEEPPRQRIAPSL